MSEQTVARERNIWVDILTLLAIFAGVVNVFDVFRFLGLLPVGELWGLSFYDRSWIGALLAGLVALIWFSVASQLWHLDSRGWFFVVIIAVVNLIFLAMAFFGASTWQSLMPQIILNVAALIMAILPGTRRAFGI